MYGAAFSYLSAIINPQGTTIEGRYLAEFEREGLFAYQILRIVFTDMGLLEKRGII